jgi:CDP-6-deoxy-D-xylo-4-hexulose-3-dehydrase
MEKDLLRQKILELVRDYHEQTFSTAKFDRETDSIPYSGRVFDAEELMHLVDASLDFWLTTGRFAAQFEKMFAKYIGVRHAMLCNSGSSANLLAVCALTSPSLKERQLMAGDEVLTVAAGFPTTVNPIIQNKLIPVFVDINLKTYNVNVDELEAAIGPRTKAIILAHTLGNPFDLKAASAIAKKHGLWLIEDNCDALGSTFESQLTGSFGDLSTSSFYPAHHITMGEGGCVLTSNSKLKRVVESFRDWGRDCFCATGRDNTCGKRFGWELGTLPSGYDHKYIYSHLGYNLKLTDMQASIGVAQLSKLPQFIAKRRLNWELLHDGLKQFEEHLILPSATTGSEPSWFGFVITVRDEAGFNRSELVQHLEANRIATRHLFGGNLLRQPAYQTVSTRVASELTITDYVMNNSFVIGVYPGISESQIAYMLETFQNFFKIRTPHRR